MPVLALGGPGCDWMKATIGPRATDFEALKVPDSGHFVQEEQPEFVTRAMIEFLKK